MEKVTLPDCLVFLPLPENRYRLSSDEEKESSKKERDREHLYYHIEYAILSKTSGQEWPKPAMLAAMAFLGGVTAYLSGIYYILPQKQHWNLNEGITDRIFDSFYQSYRQNPNKLNQVFIDYLIYQFCPHVNDPGPYDQNYVDSRFMRNWYDVWDLKPYHDNKWSRSEVCRIDKGLVGYGDKRYQEMSEDIKQAIDSVVPHIRKLVPRIIETANLE